MTRNRLLLVAAIVAAAIVVFLFIAPPTRADGYRSSSYRATSIVAKRRYRGYRSAGDDYARYDNCKDKVRGLGTQWIGEQGALDAAKKDWMERTRYDHGEKFLDMTNALDFTKQCSRVSIGEIAGQIMYRCEVWARPCKGEASIAIEGQR